MRGISEESDDQTGKPLLIAPGIGGSPIAAFANSDGARQLLAWIASFLGSRLGRLLHHDDAERRWLFPASEAATASQACRSPCPARVWLGSSPNRRR